MMQTPDYSIVIPVYRLREKLTHLIDDLTASLTSYTIEVLLVDDSGNPETFDQLKEICDTRPLVRVVQLVRNVGQHQALLCGLYAASGARIITLDDDYRYSVDSIVDLMDQGYRTQNFDVYYGVYEMNKPYDLVRDLFFAFVKLFSTLPNRVPRNGSSVRIYRKEIAQMLTTLRYPVIFLDAMQLTYAKDIRYQKIDEVYSHKGHASNYKFLHKVGFLTSLTLTYTFLPQAFLIIFALLSIGFYLLAPSFPYLSFPFIFLFFTTAIVQISFKLNADTYTCAELIQSVYAPKVP